MDGPTIEGTAEWVGRQVASRTTEPVQFSVIVSEGESSISPLPDDPHELDDLVARWRDRKVEVIGMSSAVTFEQGTVQWRVAEAMLRTRLTPDENGATDVQVSIVADAGGWDAISITTMDKQHSASLHQSPREAVDPYDLPPLISIFDDSLVALRAQLGLSTRPLPDTEPLYWLLTLWTSDVTKLWVPLAQQHGVHGASLVLLDRRPDIVWEMVHAGRSLRQAGSDDPVAWPSQQWANKEPAFIANRLYLRDERTADLALEHEWSTVTDIWEGLSGQPPPVDGPALFRLGLINVPDVSDPVNPLIDLPQFPDWLGESTVRIANVWMPDEYRNDG